MEWILWLAAGMMLGDPPADARPVEISREVAMWSVAFAVPMTAAIVGALIWFEREGIRNSKSPE